MVLRPVTTSDVDALVALDSDPEVMRYINGGTATSRDEVALGIGRSTDSMWVAHERDSNEFVGWFSLQPSGPRERELGYRLRRSAWGRGLATEGAIAIVRHAFREQRVRRVWAQTMTVNVASQRVMHKAGLRMVRTFFGDWPETIDGSDQGDVEYELTLGSMHR